MQAAANVDPCFKIIPMPDMDATIFQTATAAGTPQQALTSVITALSKYPSAYRLADGRLVDRLKNAQKTVCFRGGSSWLSQMKSQKKVSIAFVPAVPGLAALREQLQVDQLRIL